MREHVIAAPALPWAPATRVFPRARAASVATRKLVRYAAASAALAAGAIHALIAVGVLEVVEPAVKGEQAPVFIPIAASAAFVLGAVLLLVFDRRLVHVLGAVVQAVTILGYFAVAAQRTPSYEMWGIVIKVFQVLALIALVYLAVRTPRRAPATR